MTTADFPRQGDTVTRGQGDKGKVSLSPPLPVSLSPVRIALGYLTALAVAELLTALIEPRVGLVLHGVLLVILLLHTALTWEHPSHGLLLSLAFAPLIRLLSLSLPLAGVPLVYWYFITSVPLSIAAVIILRTLDFSWAGIGINLRAFPVQLLVGLTGLAFGYIEYQILEPEPLAKAFTWEQLWVPVLILFISTGFVEELIFRGVMQRAATEALGRFGLLYVAVLFAVLHVGYKSLLDVLFVLGVALFFGWVVAKTGSILGVTLSHGLTNIMLFLVVPLLPVFNPAPAPLALSTPLLPRITTNPTVTVSATPTASPAATPTALPAPTSTLIPPATATPILTATATATPSPTAVPATPTLLPRAIVAVARLNVRAGSGTDYPVLMVVEADQLYDIVGRNPAGDWWQVCCVDGREGWVFGELVTTQGDIRAVPIARDIPLPSQ